MSEASSLVPPSRPVSLNRRPSHVRIHSSSPDSSSISPPALEFLNLSGRRGSLRSDHDPNRYSDGSWNGDLPPSRRGSAVGLALNPKRSNELGWSGSKPASPGASRRPSLTPSLSFNYSSSTAPPLVHNRGRRPSSSSSAVTLRPGSPSQGGLLPFGHAYKMAHSAAAGRRSSLTPSTHVSHTNANSPTTTAISIHPSAADPHAVNAAFFTPSPSRELRSYRFGASPPHPSSPAARTHRRPSYQPPDSEDADGEDDDDDDDNNEEVDRARERFREHLVKAGLSSIPISLPATSQSATSRPKPVLGPLSKHSPYGTVTSSMDASASSSQSGSTRTASDRAPTSPVYSPLERRPSAMRYNSDSLRRSMPPAAESSSEDDEADKTPLQAPPPLRSSSSRQSIDARRLGLEYRTVIRADDEGSGIENESESEESGPGSKGSTPAFPQDGTFPNASGVSRSLAAWDSFGFVEQHPPQPSPTHELIRKLAPAVALDERPVRRSISPVQPPTIIEPTGVYNPGAGLSNTDDGKGHLGLGGMTTVGRRGSASVASPSPPRSLSDSAVPRRPSLAQELQATIPPPHLNASGAASVSGGDDIEWDLDFVLGGSGPVHADQIAPEYQIANGMRTARPGAHFDSAALGLGPGFDQLGPLDMQSDSFAKFVREKDPVFEEMRVAWTLLKPQPPQSEWALPTTGGYTYLPSFAPVHSPSRASITSNASFTSSSAAAPAPQHVQFRSPDPVIRANRPPALAWAIKKRGRGWGITPMQGSREEIRFGPKGKWRTNDTGVRSNRSSMSSKAPNVRRSSSKDQSDSRSRGGSAVSSESGMSMFVPEDDTKTSRISPDPSIQRSPPIPISSSVEEAHRSNSRKEKDKSKRKGGWLSALKNASAALSSSPASSNQSRMYSASASSSGTDDNRLPQIGSSEKQHGNYIPPWLTAGGAREKESRLASKLKLKRRSVADRRDKGASSGGENAGGDLGTSFNSRKMFETDDEADEGESREGKAWEDVPTEALAMVIPLAVPQSPASIHSARFSDPESSPDVSTGGNWTARGSVSIDPLASPGEIKPRRKARERQKSVMPPPRPENSLLVYFVPFGCEVDRDGNCTDQSHSHGSTSATLTGPSKIFQHMRLNKPKSQVFNRSSPAPLSGSGGPRPTSGYLGANLSYQSTSSSNSAGGSVNLPSPSQTPPSGGGHRTFSSFRIVARVVDPSDLTFIPSWPSWEAQEPSPHVSSTPQVMLSEPGTNPETRAKESRNGRTDPTVVGVCHGAEHGVEFIREGWERLGFVRPLPEEGEAFSARQKEDLALQPPLWGSLDEEGESALGSVLGAVTAACVAILSPAE